MIAILDYEAGNLTSVELAVKHVGGDAVVTQSADDVLGADRVVFPGVGSAKACMDNLCRLGLDSALREVIASGTPTLAICIGQHLLFEHSAEDGGVTCLGVLAGEVKRFSFSSERHVKVPHMGWNSVTKRKSHPLLKDIPDDSEFYFVHSYHVAPICDEQIFGSTEYEGKSFASIVGEANLFATQFHPEKSGGVGLTLLKNFLSWDGTIS